MKADRASLLGMDVDRVRMGEAVEKIESFVARRGHHQVCFLNAYTLSLATRHDDFRRTLSSAELALADGMPLVWASRALRDPLPERIAGADLLLEVCKISERKGYRFFFLGTSPENLRALTRNLKRLFPRLKIAGSLSPPYRKNFSESENDQMVAAVNQARPDILWVGFSSPKQDLWIARNKGRLRVPVCVGVGAAFDFLSGNVPRASLWTQRAGLEWFHRLLQEPRRLIGRYLWGNSLFILLFLREWLSRKIQGWRGRRPSLGWPGLLIFLSMFEIPLFSMKIGETQVRNSTTEILMALSVVSILIFRMKSIFRFMEREKPLTALVAALGVCALISFGLSPYKAFSLRFLIKFLGQILFFFCAASWLSERRVWADGHRVILACFLSGIAACCLSLTEVRGNQPQNPFLNLFAPFHPAEMEVNWRLNSIFSHPNIFAAWLVVSLASGMLLLNAGGSTLFKLSILTGVGLIFYSLIGTGSRNGIFASALVCLSAFFLLERIRRHWVKGLAGALLVGAALLFLMPSGLFERYRSAIRIEGSILKNPLGPREIFWGAALSVWKDHPWWGVGPGAFRKELEKRQGHSFEGLTYEERERVRGPKVYNAHNLILDSLACLGILGTLVFVGLLATLWLRVRKLYQKGEFIGLLFVAVLLPQLLFDYFLDHSVAYGFLFWILAALVVSSVNKKNTFPSPLAGEGEIP